MFRAGFDARRYGNDQRCPEDIIALAPFEGRDHCIAISPIEHNPFNTDIPGIKNDLIGSRVQYDHVQHNAAAQNCLGKVDIQIKCDMTSDELISIRKREIVASRVIRVFLTTGNQLE